VFARRSLLLRLPLNRESDPDAYDADQGEHDRSDERSEVRELLTAEYVAEVAHDIRPPALDLSNQAVVVGEDEDGHSQKDDADDEKERFNRAKEHVHLLLGMPIMPLFLILSIFTYL
jgi:hypothetical protein